MICWSLLAGPSRPVNHGGCSLLVRARRYGSGTIHNPQKFGTSRRFVFSNPTDGPVCRYAGMMFLVLAGALGGEAKSCGRDASDGAGRWWWWVMVEGNWEREEQRGVKCKRQERIWSFGCGMSSVCIGWDFRQAYETSVRDVGQAPTQVSDRQQSPTLGTQSTAMLRCPPLPVYRHQTREIQFQDQRDLQGRGEEGRKGGRPAASVLPSGPVRR